MIRAERETLRTKIRFIRGREISLESKLALLEPDKESGEHEVWDDAMRLQAETFNQLNELEGMLK